jgi:hypothetical protein
MNAYKYKYYTYLNVGIFYLNDMDMVLYVISAVYLQQ